MTSCLSNSQNSKNFSPRIFENLVVELLVKTGYGGSRKDAGESIGGTVDGGIDGIIKEDKLGLDTIYIQAKRWEKITGEKLNELDPNKKLTTLLSVYNVIAMAARPKK